MPDWRWGRRSLLSDAAEEERFELGDGAEWARGARSAGERVVAAHLQVGDGTLQIAQVGKNELTTVAALDHPPLGDGRDVRAEDLELLAAVGAAHRRTPLRDERVVEVVLGLAALAGDFHRWRAGLSGPAG